MSRIVLLSCVSKKLSNKAKARDLYVSAFFRHSMGYAMTLKPDKVFILSAKYGLLELNDVISPYEQTLKKMSIIEVRKWADNVKLQLEKVADLASDEFIFLTGERYRRFLLPHITNYQIPLEGMGIGKQLQQMKRAYKNE
jgi:cytoplasmic iron level regulating protein YaaA (DUF328/UPF0246 family)